MWLKGTVLTSSQSQRLIYFLFSPLCLAFPPLQLLLCLTFSPLCIQSFQSPVFFLLLSQSLTPGFAEGSNITGGPSMPGRSKPWFRPVQEPESLRAT